MLHHSTVRVDHITAVLRGDGYKAAAGRLKISETALKEWVRKQAAMAGMTTDQWRVSNIFSLLGLGSHKIDDDNGEWESGIDYSAICQEKWDEIKNVAALEVDGAVFGRAVSYLVTPEPDFRFVYANPQTYKLYGLDLDSPIVGLSLWQAMVIDNIADRFLNLRQYHEKRVMMAKAIWLKDEWCGERQETRTKELIEPYRAFLEHRLPGVWEDAQPNFRAISADYEKRLSHWDPVQRHPKKPLVFQVHWSYRPEWDLYQAVYTPKRGYTWDVMTGLQKELKASGVL
jgi:hypothetical protein